MVVFLTKTLTVVPVTFRIGVPRGARISGMRRVGGATLTHSYSNKRTSACACDQDAQKVCE